MRVCSPRWPRTNGDHFFAAHFDRAAGRNLDVRPDQRKERAVVRRPDDRGHPTELVSRGHSLQFYDPEFSEIRVLDLHDDRVILIPTDQQAIGSWSRDEQTLLFTRAESSEIGLPIVRIYQRIWAQVNFTAGTRPTWELWMPAVLFFHRMVNLWSWQLRPLAGAQNKQLWLVQADGSGASPITDDRGPRSPPMPGTRPAVGWFFNGCSSNRRNPGRR